MSFKLSDVVKVTVREDGSRRVQALPGKEPSLTKQSFAPDCDIQNIVARALRGQPVSQVASSPIYADVSALPDYQTSLNQVRAVDAAFMSLDAVTRQRFDNNPANMLDFVADSRNHALAVKLGILDASILPPAGQAEGAKAPEAAAVAAQGTGA